MSYLTDHPDVMMEALAVLVRRLGGSVTIRAEEGPGPFTLLSKHGDGVLHLVLDETVTSEDVLRLQANDSQMGH